MAILRISVLLLAGLVIQGCGNPEAQIVVPPTPVASVAAVAGPAAAAIRTNGMVVNKDEMRLSFKTGGVIKRIAVREGEHVKRGQTLAEIELTEVNAQVEQALQGAEKSERDLKRAERLYADQVITLEQLQDLRTQAAMSHAGLDAVKFNSGYSVITAPRDGVILRTVGKERELVTPGTPVIIFGAQDTGFIVKLGLADREVVQVRVGDSASISLDAYPHKSWHGKVSEVASGADERTGTFPIEVKLDPTDVVLISGLVAKVAITPYAASLGTRVRVPITAIVEGQGMNATVFVLDKQQARKRKVQVAFIDDTQVALVDGVQPGERVITDGALYLEDGEQVSVARADPP